MGAAAGTLEPVQSMRFTRQHVVLVLSPPHFGQYGSDLQHTAGLKRRWDWQSRDSEYTVYLQCVLSLTAIRASMSINAGTSSCFMMVTCWEIKRRYLPSFCRHSLASPVDVRD